MNHPNKYVHESRIIYEKLSEGSIKQEPLANSSIALISGSGGAKTVKVMAQSSSQSSSAVKSDDDTELDVTINDGLDAGIFESMDAMGC